MGKKKKKDKPTGSLRIPMGTRAGGSHKSKKTYTRKIKHKGMKNV